MTVAMEYGPPRRSLPTGLLWTGTLLLSLVGVTAAMYRAVHLADATMRAEPVRERMLRALGRSDPRLAERPAELRRFDSDFAAHPLLTLGHVIPGAVFLAFAPLQFWTRLRNRHRRIHRWSGRVLILAVLVCAGPALYFGLGAPFAGGGEALIIALVAGFLVTALVQAFVAIRRGQVARHREWMLRAFALALGIATTRVVGAVLDVALAPLGMRFEPELVLNLWAGWVLTVAGAELWIICTRPRARDPADAPSAA